MIIYIVEPYYTDSHKYWAENLKASFGDCLKIFHLPGRHWKWRMQAAAITLAKQISEHQEPDHIIASDMCNLPLLMSLLPKDWNRVKVNIYFHENQITFPWSENDQDVQKRRENHYGFINYISALVADHVIFNSEFHRNEFLESLPDFISQFPDFHNRESMDTISEKSRVVPIGINSLNHLIQKNKWTCDTPTILWNHRWEYDKNPESFFNILFDLKEEGSNFNLIVLGNSGNKYPDIFDKAKNLLKGRIIHWGFINSREDYLKTLSQCHLLPVSSIQDFFGVSMLEAVSLITYPLLPNRLAFPEHFTDTSVYYSSEVELKGKLKSILEHWAKISPVLRAKAEVLASEVSAKYNSEKVKHELSAILSN